jgi:hypothetical protein
MGDINHYMPTKYYKGGRLLLGELYELIEENEVKFLLQISNPWYQIHYGYVDLIILKFC